MPAVIAHTLRLGSSREGNVELIFSDIDANKKRSVLFHLSGILSSVFPALQIRACHAEALPTVREMTRIGLGDPATTRPWIDLGAERSTESVFHPRPMGRGWKSRVHSNIILCRNTRGGWQSARSGIPFSAFLRFAAETQRGRRNVPSFREFR